jgi:hypothetical protein
MRIHWLYSELCGLESILMICLFINPGIINRVKNKKEPGKLFLDLAKFIFATAFLGL